ncbi:hypothetical protein [Quadrisphaera setariae]|uniref:Uncharacterized protein n=1 Tax=Quadrisphaera setariae TaxID=2593304 RepID=A0A5C8Z5R4_9ACTN|nr:hypothetical protein [Quadrisphaera setariae]TXR52528.1 hypothetical protein FMM08_18920 [Quadrisphaera setariae]
MSERRFQLVSALLAGGVLVLLLAVALLWYVPINAGNTVCGRAVESHAGVEWHYLDGPLSPEEQEQNDACNAAGEPLWVAGLAAAAAGGTSLVAALVVVTGTWACDRRTARP